MRKFDNFLVVAFFVLMVFGMWQKVNAAETIKFQPPKYDAWYWEDVAGMPDKWEHFTGNQWGAVVLKNQFGVSNKKIIALFTIINLIDELLIDSRKEGASVRDFMMDNLGLWSGLTGAPLICEWSSKEKRIYLKFYWRG